MGVVLSSEGMTKMFYAAWEKWCMKHNIPFVNAESSDIMATEKAINTLDKMILLAFQRKDEENTH